MLRLFAALVLSLNAVSPSLAHAAEDGSRKPPELTKEQRQKRADLMDRMADFHKKLAECLRSDKPMAECHEMMKKDCPMAKDEGGCPMMGGMRGMHHGMHGKGRMMKGDDDSGKKD